MEKFKDLSQRELEALVKRCEYTLGIFPGSDALLSMAEIYLALGKITIARRAVSDFTEKAGDSSRARVVLARAHLMSLKTTSAEEELKKALRLDPENDEASDLLVEVYRNTGKQGEAFRLSLRRHAGLPEPPPVSDTEKTEEPPEEPTEPEKKPKPRAGVFETDTMLNLYISQGLYEDALQIVEALLELEPENPAYISRREEIETFLRG